MTVFVYGAVLLVAPRIFDPGVLKAFTIFVTPGMLVLLAAMWFFAWDRDHFNARCALATDLPAVSAAYRALARQTPELRLVEAPEEPRWDSVSSDGLAAASRWLKAHAVVERKLPPRLNVTLDLVLLLLGALTAAPFADFWQLEAEGNPREFSASGALAAAAVVAAGLLVASLVSRWGTPSRLWTKIAGRVSGDPVNFVQHLPFRDSAFAYKFHCDLSDALAMCASSIDGLQGAARVAGVDVNGGVPLGVTALTDFALKLWQYWAGLVLGVAIPFALSGI